MPEHSKPFLTNRKAAKLRKRLFKYTANNSNGETISGYIKADNISLARWIISSKNPTWTDITIECVVLNR